MAAAALFAASSCSDLKFGNAFLEKAPGADMTLEQIFSSKLFAERELVGAYASLRTSLTVHSNNGRHLAVATSAHRHLAHCPGVVTERHTVVVVGQGLPAV